MKVEKKVIARLPKCYAVTRLAYKGKPCFLVAAEKQDPCYLFSEDGDILETVWDGPGGVMTMEQVPGSNGQFLATRKFYSPNDSKEASIVTATPKEGGGWEVRKLCDLPFVHRFAILKRDGVNWLFACTVKSGHEYKDDWRFPGACYAAPLPEDLSVFDDAHQLELSLVKAGMLRNHGFSKVARAGYDAGLVGCEEGTFLFTPPKEGSTEWEITQLCGAPSSDSVLIDLDGDGMEELGYISPFHGDELHIAHLNEKGVYEEQWTCPVPREETQMLHATWACELLGRPAWIVGWRKGTRNTAAILWDGTDYVMETIDEGAGCANAMKYTDSRGNDIVIGANRESDEVAMYCVTED